MPGEGKPLVLVKVSEYGKLGRVSGFRSWISVRLCCWIVIKVFLGKLDRPSLGGSMGS